MPRKKRNGPSHENHTAVSPKRLRSGRKTTETSTKGTKRSRKDDNHEDVSQKNELVETVEKLPETAHKVLLNDKKINNVDNSSESEESEWEEVEQNDIISSDEEKEPVIPEGGVEITIEVPDELKKHRTKNQFDMQVYFRRLMKRFKKEVQLGLHKVHLLCLLARGLYVHGILGEDLVRAVGFSIVPTYFLSLKPAQRNKEHLKRLLDWFRDKFTLKFETDPVRRSCEESSGSVMEALLQGFENRSTDSPSSLVYMLLVIIRVIGFDARLVVSFQPLPFSVAVANKFNGCNSKKKKAHVMKSKVAEKEEEISGTVAKSSRKRKLRKSEPPSKAEKSDDDKQPSVKNNRRPRRRTISKVTSYKDNSDSSENDAKPQPKKIRESRKVVDVDSDEDFQVQVVKISRPPSVEVCLQNSQSRPCKGLQKNRKALSSESESDVEVVSCSNGQLAAGNDHWIEVYLAKDKLWITVDCLRQCIDCHKDMEKYATKPMSYVVAFDNRNFVKDVTARYASSWMSYTRKLRVGDDWWDSTLRPFQQKRKTQREKLEDEQLDDHWMQQPLPKAISEYKNHPLYALKRHLLKFEAIYPPDAVPVGFIRKEPVYYRECVRVLHSRENWMKEALVVKVGETPYKVVKARPKWIRHTHQFEKDIPLQLFGEWQTEKYVPPPAVDGKVPRNEYGNVELFKPSMLPEGTVHLQRLNRVARKMGIDCAAAMTGWDFHGGSCHPTFDGFIVCEEYKESLLEAWEEEQAIILQKEHDKKEKRIYGNWRRLIRGLLIGERLRNKYALNEKREVKNSEELNS